MPSLFEVHPGTEALEREVFDMFGIRFDGHPDLTRILMPEDWDGHPLRKDYAVGRIPVQFKGDRRPDDDHRRAPTDADRRRRARRPRAPDRRGRPGDGAPHGRGRRRGAARARLACCACPRPRPPQLADADPDEAETTIINMGPQHPSTHGVLRLMLELDGETVLRTKPIIGYLHTGMEKTGEDLTYLQGPTNVTRMDYASPLFNELVFSLAAEKLLEHRDARRGPRGSACCMCELNRIASHLLFLGHQRHGPRRRVDDALRLARARGGAAVPREGHRPADEPQLHPPRRRRRRPAPTAGATTCSRLLDAHPAAPRRVRRPA